MTRELRMLGMALVVLGLAGVAYFGTTFVLRFFWHRQMSEISRILVAIAAVLIAGALAYFVASFVLEWF
jgi:hypothetical protein